MVHPALARAMGNDEATAALHGTHNEIYRLARVFRELVGTLPAEGPEPEDLAELRRVLYGLHADPAAAPIPGGGTVRVGDRSGTDRRAAHRQWTRTGRARGMSSGMRSSSDTKWATVSGCSAGRPGARP